MRTGAPARQAVPVMATPTRRRADAGERWRGVLIALAVTAAIILLDLVEGSGRTQFVGLLVSVPFLAAALTGPRRTALCGVLATLAAYLLGLVQIDSHIAGTLQPTHPQSLRLAFLVAATAGGVLVAQYRVESERRLRRLTRIAEVAQATVLRPVPDQLGPLRLAVRYASASAEARIGGDLYEVLETPYGVRVLVGDVRGKGLDAVRLASIVLGAFRETAFFEPDLGRMLLSIDRSLRRVTGDEDFVTALVVQVTDEGEASVANCAHPPPLLVGSRGGSDRTVTAVDPPADALPLAMLDEAPPTRLFELEPGDVLLLYTDGATEARAEGRLFDLEPAVGRAFGAGWEPVGLNDRLERLVTELQGHVSGRLQDDVALLALTRTQVPATTVHLPDPDAVPAAGR